MPLKFYTDESAPHPPTHTSRCTQCDTLADPCLSHPRAARYEESEQSAAYTAWRKEYPSSTWRTEWISGGGQQAAIERNAVDRDPFKCERCDTPLNLWARSRGFTFCSRECREAARTG